jgi:hypothetical protein
MRMKHGEKWADTRSGITYLFLSVEVNLTAYASRPLYKINGLNLISGRLELLMITGNSPNKPGEIQYWKKLED